MPKKIALTRPVACARIVKILEAFPKAERDQVMDAVRATLALHEDDAPNGADLDVGSGQ